LDTEHLCGRLIEVTIPFRPVAVVNLLSSGFLTFELDVRDAVKVNSSSDRCQNSRRE
jgi:hypothetical protein